MTGGKKATPKKGDAPDDASPVSSFDEIMKELDEAFPVEGPSGKGADGGPSAADAGHAAEGDAGPTPDETPIVDAHAVTTAPEAPQAIAPAAKERSDRAMKKEVPGLSGPSSFTIREDENPMRSISIDKVVINIGVGEAGEKLVKAKTILERLTGQKPVETISRTTNRDLGIRKGQPLGCKVTLRGQRAEEFVQRALWIKDFRLPAYCFDPEGNVSFGIPDYTEFKDMKYDPEIGIFGMDICTVLGRPGFRIKRRRVAKAHVPHRHRLTAEEGKEFMRRRFNVEVLEVR